MAGLSGAIADAVPGAVGRPPKGKKGRKRWLLIVVGAGVLLVLVMVLKRKGSGEEEVPKAKPEIVAPATGLETGLGGGLGGGSVGGGEQVPVPGLEGAPGPVGAEGAPGPPGPAEAPGASPADVKAAESAAYHRGVEKVNAQHKAKKTAVKKPGHPHKPAPHTAPKHKNAKKTPVHHHAARHHAPAHHAPAHKAPVHHAAAKPTPAHHPAPKPKKRR